MAYTLRQAQPLLTKPELELFSASRAPNLKELTARQLAAKITRARALRDKYRDTYRRQTVSTRTGPASQRTPAGGENARTETKAEIMAEVLERLMAQQEKQQQSQAKAAAKTAKSPAKTPAKTTAKPAAKNIAKPATKTATAKKVANPKAIASADKPAASLVKAVRKAVAQKTGAPEGAAEAAATLRKTSRARAKLATGASDLAQGGVSAGMPAAAQRQNPLKQEPVNQKIHAGVRSRGKSAQAKRDAR